MRRRVTLALFAAALVAAFAPCVARAQNKDAVVNFYNWNDYIDPGVLEEFTRRTGIRVQYDVFDANETLETKLLAGKSGYDVVVPTAYFLERQIQAKVFEPLDRARLPNLANAWPAVADRLAQYDPGAKFAANYMWGTVGIGYNVKAVRAILGDNAVIDSWATMFDPAQIARFKDCGVHMLDSADDVLPAALNWLGLDPNASDQASLEKTADAVSRVRPFVRKFHSSEYLNALAGGEICMVLGWSGDIKQAKKRADEAKNGVDIAYVIPKEGGQMFFDNLAIPADAPHKDAAYQLINFLYEPAIAARNTNFLGYANGNLASQAMISPAILADRTVYPPEDVMKKLFVITARDARTQRLLNRMWTRVKTGL